MTPSAAAPDLRRRLGQYWTPPGVAAWMADWVVQPATRSVLDPAVGAGALLQPLLGHSLLAPDAALTGIDVDPEVLAVAAQALGDTPRSVQLEAADFLWLDDARRFDAVVCNPPYVRHRALVDRAALYGRIERELGIRLDRFSNSYLLFMLRIAQRLTATGRAAILAPVDWLNANFGTPLKAFLVRENLLDGVVVFGQHTLVFREANIAACVALLRAGRDATEPVLFARVPTEAELVPLDQLPAHRRAELRLAQLEPAAKWLPHVPPEVTAPAAIVRHQLVSLGKLATVRRGIATGANEFFTLTQSERAALGLAAESRPCVAKAPHAPWLEFTADDFAALAAAETKAYLLDLQGELAPAAAAYVERGRAAGIDQRYLPRNRRPWYSSEARAVTPLWATTFSRRGFRFVVNTAGVANLTAFHGITPRAYDAEWLAVLAAWLNSRPGRASLAAQQRSLGSGLAKLEPRDVAALAVPDPATLAASMRAEIAALWAERGHEERVGGQLAAQELDRLWESVERG